VPALLTLPSASNASLTFLIQKTRAITDLRIWAGVSTSSFLLAYVLSPRGTRHPYLLWTSLLVASSGLTDYVLRPERAKTIAAARQTRKKEKGGKMEASYEVLGDSHSEGTNASDEAEEDVNGEELRSAVEGFRLSQMIRLALAGTGFAMSLVGIWGDGA
jgi:autophagy-related protein 33